MDPTSKVGGLFSAPTAKVAAEGEPGAAIVEIRQLGS